MFIPLAGGVSEGVIEGITEGVGKGVPDTVLATVTDTIKERMVRMIIHLYKQSGLKSKELAKVLEVSEVSVRHDIQKINRLVELKGAPKTGGYTLSREMYDKLHEKGR